MKKTYFVSAWLPSYVSASEPGCDNACLINCTEVKTLEGVKKLEEACAEIFSNSAAVLTCWKLLEDSPKNNVEGKTFDYEILFPPQDLPEDEEGAKNNDLLSDYEKSLLKSEEEMIADACATIESELAKAHGHDIMIFFPDVTRSGQYGSPEALANTQRMADKVKDIYEAKGYRIRMERYKLSDFREFFLYFNE